MKTSLRLAVVSCLILAGCSANPTATVPAATTPAATTPATASKPATTASATSPAKVPATTTAPKPKPVFTTSAPKPTTTAPKPAPKPTVKLTTTAPKPKPVTTTSAPKPTVKPTTTAPKPAPKPTVKPTRAAVIKWFEFEDLGTGRLSCWAAWTPGVMGTMTLSPSALGSASDDSGSFAMPTAVLTKGEKVTCTIRLSTGLSRTITTVYKG